MSYELSSNTGGLELKVNKLGGVKNAEQHNEQNDNDIGSITHDRIFIPQEEMHPFVSFL